MTKPSLLDILEYVSVAGSVAGSVAAVASQQIIYAATPLSLSVVINLANRRRLAQEKLAAHKVSQVNEQLSQEVGALRDRVNGLPTDSEFNFVQSAVAKHSETLEALQQQVETTLSLAKGLELNPLRQDIARLRENYASVQESLSGTIARLDAVEAGGKGTAGIERLEAAIAQINSKVAQFQNRVSKIETPSPSTDLTPVFGQISQLQQQLDTLEERDLSSIKQQLEQSNQELAQLRLSENQQRDPEKISALESAIQELDRRQNALSDAVTPVRNLSHQLEELSQKVAQQPEIEQVEQLRSALASAIALLPELKDHLGEQNLSQAASAIQPVDLTGVEESLAKIAESVAEAIAEMEQRIEPLEAVNLNRLQDEMQAQTKDLAQLREQLVGVQQEQGSWESSLNALSDKIDDKLSAGLSPEAIANLETAFATLQQRVDELSSLPYPEIHEQIEGLDGRLSQLAVGIASQDELTQLQQAVADISDRVTQLDQTSDRLASKTEVREQIAQVESAIAELNQSLENAGVEQRQLAEQLQRLRYGDESQTNGALSATIDREVTHQIHDLIEQFNARPEFEQIQTLRESVSELYEHLEQLPPPSQSTPGTEPESLQALRQEVADLHAALARVSESANNFSEVTPLRIENLERDIEQLETELREFAGQIPQGELHPQLEQLTQQIQAMVSHPEASELLSVDGKNMGLAIAKSVEQQLEQIHQLLQGIQAHEYQLVFDRPSIREQLETAIDSTQQRLILVCPWLSRASIDHSLVQKIEELLKRGAQIDIGWGHLRDIEAGEFPIRINERWQSDPVVKRGLYDALNELEALKESYPNQLRFKILGTHENFIVRDDAWAMVATHHFLSSSDALPEREVGLRTSDPRIIRELTARFSEPTLNPANASAYYNRGFERLDIGDYAGAVEDYTQAIAMNSNQPTAYNNRGLAKFHMGDIEGAIADYSRSLELNPQESVVYFNRGFARFDGGDYQGAIADYSQAIALTPEQTGAYFYRGEAYGVLGDYARALEDYSQAIQLNPHDAVAYNNRGLARYNQGDYAGAIEDYTTALSLKPEDAVAYSNRGVARSARADYQGAIEDFDRAIGLNGNYAGAYNNRGLARAEIGDIPGAMADLQIAADLFSRQGDALNHSQAMETLNKLSCTAQ
ncbi:tetratricopeptide repeat protein [Phormidium sp. CCY1219]|uniref:tetratricopeptide repeat protein n=1 Tax=Phormidium sp. CCY1219 TaxID=2886104 RepID=UPI002D1F2AB6|nr:tetratricopeptide repeat protein [Phormidium sp. CCY1219]MEB3828701.1 tetratricopeptide repeat protein [Phormidium sp. CCY1219]